MIMNGALDSKPAIPIPDAAPDPARPIEIQKLFNVQVKSFKLPLIPKK